MSDEDSTKKDTDLLARLNALKKSPVTLEHTPTVRSVVVPSSRPDLNPEQALHADLLSRFGLLKGSNVVTKTADSEADNADDQDDGKTIEELLADLGPSSQWEVTKSDEEQVEELLRSAQGALKMGSSENGDGNEHESDHPETSKALPAVDVSVFQPGPELEEDEHADGSTQPPRALADEADDVLDRIFDEVRLEATDDDHAHEATSAPTEDITSAPFDPKQDLDLPSTPSTEPPTLHSTGDAEDEHLSSRFASLSLPSVPTTIKSVKTAPSQPPSKPGFPDEEVDSWCIICLNDAKLQCIGCDGDLYCSNCWVEGHRGPDAGMEEKTHRAVQFVKKGKKQVSGKRRVGVGA